MTERGQQDQAMKSYGGTDGKDRIVMPAILRGLRRKCPCCGEGAAFAGYLKLAPECAVCHTPLGEIRADDFPPYLTIFLVGHLIVPALLYTEKLFSPPTWFQITFWPAMALVLSLTFLPFLKGAAVGLMWALGLKGDEQH